MLNLIFQYLPPVLGFIFLLASFLLPLIERYKTKRSIREIVEGDNLFNSEQILSILKEFSNDGKRLEALETLTNHDAKKAKQILDRIKSNVDLNKVERDDQRNYSLTLLIVSILFLALSVAILFLYTPSNQEVNDKKDDNITLPECSGKPIKDLPFKCLIEREKFK